MGYKEESELIRMAISSLAADKMGEYIYLLEEKVNRVRELHKPRELFCGDQVCEICYDEFGSFGVGVTYPCPTIKALDEESEYPKGPVPRPEPEGENNE